MVLVHEKFLGKNLAEWEKAVLLQPCSGDGQGAGERGRKKEGLRFGGLKKKTYLCAPKREREGRGRPGRPGVFDGAGGPGREAAGRKAGEFDDILREQTARSERGGGAAGRRRRA